MIKHALLISLLSFSSGLFAAETTITMNKATSEGSGEAIGTITLSETPYGVLFTPALQQLQPGVHGFHIHVNASCEATNQDGKITPAGAAGGHFDPQDTGKHLGPYNNDGHFGDLPAIYVDEQGQATYPVLAPKIKTIKEIGNRAIMVHVGGENHSDIPLPLGGGGARFACGIIAAQ